MGARLSGPELRTRRLGMRMSQRELAAELGVTATTVARWERGERAISNAVLVRLALDQLAGNAAVLRPAPLPAATTELIGRERELAALAALLTESQIRLVTLTGPGGAGKTVLALAALREAAGPRTDGGCLVELADLPAAAPPAAIAAAFASALGVREVSGEPPADTLAQALRPSDALLLVDNCEHVTATIADLVGVLIARCPELTVLATSREPLRIRAERRFDVPPLRVPDLARLPPPASLVRVPAVNLFVTRWSAANPGFRLTSAHSAAVAEICVRLDGLPLALELAAAHGRPPTPTALLSRLDSLPEFTGPGHRDVPQRHRSLRTMLDWSYDLLDQRTQAVFRRLAVFAGSFEPLAATLVAADADGSGSPASVVVSRAIETLIEANLVVSYQTPDGRHRLRLLQTVRAYALDRLAAADELNEAARRHVMWLIGWTEAGAAGFENESQLAWLDALEAEIGNLRAALAWGRSDQGDADLGLRLAAAMRRYWDMRGRPSEAHEQLGELLARSPAASSARLYALLELGGLAISREDPATIERHAREAAQLASELDDLRGAANASEQLAYAAFLSGDLALAGSLADQSLDQAITASHPLAVAHAWMARGVVAFGTGALDAAAADLEQALNHGRSQQDRWFVGECASVLAFVHLARGSYQTAREAEAESLAARAVLKNRPAMAVSLKIIGIADAATGSPARAVVLLGGAAAIEETTTATWQSHWLNAYQEAVATAREALGQRFAALWEFGRTMSDAEIVKLALLAPPIGSLPDLPGRRPHGRAGGLSQRETQVSELITEGLTSQDIARRLGVARRTIDAHTEHIMTKLGIHSRAQVAAWVERNRIRSPEP